MTNALLETNAVNDWFLGRASAKYASPAATLTDKRIRGLFA